MTMAGRIVFLDYLRVVACFMVMVIHSCEPFYLAVEDGMTVTRIASRGDALCVTLVECLCRVCVPLFVMASSYLLFPTARPAGEFLRRRFVRILVPFLVWSVAYVWYFGGEWGKLAFNFPDAGGHLWFVPMLLGLYLAMPLLSPWAEKVGEKELRGWVLLWLATTTFPFLRKLWGTLYGVPPFGSVPYLWGECPWNMFGSFHYVSGFVGYVLLGFWFRKFVPGLSWRKTLKISLPLWAAGVAIVGGFFLLRIPGCPFTKSYAFAVDLEMSIEYCSTGVALASAAAFMVLRKFTWDNAFYRRLVRPLSEASYGAYLLHMFILVPVFEFFRPLMPTPAAIAATATVSFALSSLSSLVLGRIPAVGRWVAGS
jgi:surface polysaccharide O-acyltransferase-like enzyme